MILVSTLKDGGAEYVCLIWVKHSILFTIIKTIYSCTTLHMLCLTCVILGKVDMVCMWLQYEGGHS